MDIVDTLIVGAGVSGLSFANWIRAQKGPDVNLLVLEKDAEPGGYCKTIKQDGFIWDYSGHFFHFKDSAIEAWLRERMPGQEILSVQKKSLIRFKGKDVDFPFQKNIHQLPKEDFIDCLHDLYFREGGGAPTSFQSMLYQNFGRGIAEKFLVPYNEKLYACDLSSLDVHAMGRFFPQANIDEIIRNMRTPDNQSYNSTFTYPLGGAIEYINALLKDLPDEVISYNEELISVDVDCKIATTNRRKIKFETMVTSAPLPHLLSLCQMEYDKNVYSWNKVLVFNLGFSAKGKRDVHWMYFPSKDLNFYRVGWYDNIMGTDRMSLYVEIGLPTEAPVDSDEMLKQVLAGLKEAEITTDHRLISSHHITLDPAYVHITQASIEQVTTVRKALSSQGVYSMGRYGGWTYCAIEDNILEAKSVVESLYSCTVQL